MVTLYTSADGTFYDGTLSESSNMCLISPATCTGGGGEGSARVKLVIQRLVWLSHRHTRRNWHYIRTNNYTINGFEDGWFTLL